jgi:alkylated DNA repair protein alkB family protein 6
MTGSLYQSHLHGISFSDTDILTPSFVSSVPIANLALLGNPEISRTIEKEGSYRSERSTRVSLTFRKVERVMKGGLGAGGGKGLFGLAKR